MEPAPIALERRESQAGGSVDRPEGAIELTSSLDSLQEIDPQFDLAAFLVGARRAYEAILQAYADGDIHALNRLVGPEVLDAYEREVAGRRDREETLQLTFIGTRDAKIVDGTAALR